MVGRWGANARSFVWSVYVCVCVGGGGGYNELFNPDAWFLPNIAVRFPGVKS